MAEAPLAAEPPAASRPFAGPSIALHWIVAALIVLELGLGWYLNEAMVDHSPAQERMQDIHVEIGLTLLFFVLARILARIVYRAPPLPDRMAGWEKGLAHAVHALLYVLMIVVPLSGWALLTARHAPIPFWGLSWPDLPGVTALGGDNPRAVGRAMKAWHIYWLIWAVVIALALHVAGAIKHQFDGHPVLWRMLPFLRRRGSRDEPGPG